MSKNFYIQGDPSRAKEIKAAFEKLGYEKVNVIHIGDYANERLFFFTENGKVRSILKDCGIVHIIKTHPDYQELELSVEPKFKIGDWVVRWDDAFTMSIKSVRDENYYFHQGASLPIKEVDEHYHLWTIEDAKEGDVLALSWCDENGKWDKVVIFKSLSIVGVVGYGCTFRNDELAFDIDAPYYSTTWPRTLKPATKEQCDLLFTKIKEAGYEWDVEKKEIHKTLKRYDINNFKAGMPVLVRETSLNTWQYVLFSHCYTVGDGLTRFNAGLVGFSQCIPFNKDTEHLLGTTDMCDEQYVNW